jgi:YqaJ-like viral recombinase domain
MIIHDCIQGSTEWLHLRAGIPTSSCFDQILTPSGKPSKSAERYLFTLLAERMMGHPVTEFMSHWMDRGSQAEAEAVSFYEFTRDLPTTKIGFITNDIGTIGTSPDRFVNEDGHLEIKVPNEATHVAYLMQTGSAYEAYKMQIQGQLWITSRQWCDILSYHPEMPPALIRIERDEGCIQVLSVAVEAFSRTLEALYQEVINRGWVKRTVGHEPTIVELLKESLIEVSRAK